jgi:hypothetical protein
VTVNQLAQEVVQFVAQGVQDVLAAYNQVAARSAAFAGQAAAGMATAARGVGPGLVTGLRNASAWLSTTGRQVNRFAMQMRGLSMLARRFVLGGGLSLAGIFAGAAKNTVELDNFKRALTELAQTLGDKLAPYLRFVTDAAERLSAWWRTLSDETQRSITRWALVTVALAGLATTLPLIIRAVGSLMMVLGALANPFVAIPVAIFAIAAAFLYVTAEGDNFADKMGSITERVITYLAVVKAGFRSLARDAELAFAPVGAFLDMLQGKNPADAAGRIAAAFGNRAAAPGFAQILAQEMAAAAAVIDKAKGAIKAIAGAGEGPGFSRKFKVEFESLGATWDRLMKSFGENDEAIQKQQLEQQKKAADALQKANAQLDDIGGKLPVVV